MRICIYGAGAMGTSLGVLLDEMSLDFVTHNAAHAEAMNRDGAIIEGALTKCVKVRAKLPSEMEGQYDIVILAVKQRENHAASIFLKPFLKEDGALVTVQNGLPERELAEVFGKDRVYGCALSWSAETVRPGVVRVTSDTGFHLALGAYGKGERLEELAPLFAHAGTLTVGDLAEIRFAKLAVNASFSTLSAISGLTFYELAKKHRTLSLALIREVLAVAKGCGCEKLPLNGHDLFKVFGGKFAKILLPIAMRSYKETRSGMLRDIQAGRRCDVDFVAGAAVRAGRDCGVPTPLMERAVALVHDVENGIAEIAPETLRLLQE